jgi:type IV pilus assembly protein PilV
LLEVLVAILVLSVGILGAAAAQVASLQTRHASALLSNGVQLASTLAERMRANPEQLRAPDDANPYLQLQYDASDGAPPEPAPCFAGAACPSAQMAAFDIAETMQVLHRDFPGGRVRVCRDDATSLAWDCTGAAHAPVVVKLGWLRRQPDGSWRALPAVAMVVEGAAP